MIVPPSTAPTTWTVADLLDRFGPMPLSRFRFAPHLAQATEQDVIDLDAHEDRLYELVDGILVEKTVGFLESVLAGSVGYFLSTFLGGRKLGVVAGAGGMMRFAPGLVRIPDVSFISWDHFPDRRVPDEPIPDVFPDLAVEILSPDNTEKEMTRKLQEYFTAGTQLVWFVNQRARTVTVYTSPDHATVLHEDQTLDGGSVLPGFTLPLRQLFAEPDS